MVDNIASKVFPGASGQKKVLPPLPSEARESERNLISENSSDMVSRSFFGKYRGKVVGNIDPLGMGRVQVFVPAVPGKNCASWAMPCVPYAGEDIGFFALPPVGASVWVEFEEGNPDHPIWSGCFWESGLCPQNIPEKKVFSTATASVTLDDIPGKGGIILETADGAKIVIGSAGIELNSGKGISIRLEGKRITVNGRTLEGI